MLSVEGTGEKMSFLVKVASENAEKTVCSTDGKPWLPMVDTRQLYVADDSDAHEQWPSH